MSRLVLWTSCVFFALWAVGEACGDLNWTLGLLFYIPSPVVAAWLGLTTIGMALTGQLKRATLLLALSAFPWGATFWLDARFDGASAPIAPPSEWTRQSGSSSKDSTTPGRRAAKTPESQPARYRVCHWNILSGKRGWTRSIAELRTRKADLYLLSETPRGRNAKFVAKDFGGDHSVLRFGRLAAVSRFPLDELTWLVNTSTLELARFSWELPERTLRVFMVDMTSEIGITRDGPLRTILEFIEKEQPDLILGDFNSPRRSLALQSLPSGYRHAHESVGRGFGYSWPEPVPLLAIDQCIYGAKLEAKDYLLEPSRYSDHRRQVFDFELSEKR